MRGEIYVSGRLISLIAILVLGAGIVSAQQVLPGFPHGVFSSQNARDPASTPVFTPASISGLQLWFDASNAASITQVAGAVSQWNDLSGNANNAVQATGANQPAVETAAQNGLNTLGFLSTAYMTLTTPINVDAAYTVVAVVHQTSQIDILGQSTLATVFLMEIDATTAYSANSSGYDAATISTTGYNVFIGTMTGSTGSIYLNGSDTSAAFSAYALSPVTALDRIGYGNSINSDGYIAEFEVYDAVLTSGQIAQLQAYEKAKWATP